MPDYKTNDPKGWHGDPSRGAAMGRSPIHDALHDFDGMLTLKRIPIVDGYDPNGTYFGDGEPLYWYADEDGTIDAVLRAANRENAKANILMTYPKARFAPETDKLLDIDDFVRGYVRAALWSSNDESDESGGQPFDANYSEDDITEESMVRMRRDCEQFAEENADDLELYCANVEYNSKEGTPSEYAGYDFWLTSRGHGCGFWDRDGVGKYGVPRGPEGLGERLSKATKGFGGDLYLGDDGKIHYE